MNKPAQWQQPSGTEQQRDRVSGHEKHSYQGPGRLAAKTAVITGAGSGIGEAAAFAFAREGAADEASYVSGARLAVTAGKPVL